MARSMAAASPSRSSFFAPPRFWPVVMARARFLAATDSFFSPLSFALLSLALNGEARLDRSPDAWGEPTRMTTTEGG